MKRTLSKNQVHWIFSFLRGKMSDSKKGIVSLLKTCTENIG
ncbi:hypothetical protein LEP1GSC125_1330 [Leptospira mayottensis 200901122]|uniref:Uncharacterized protein n=1 Tax=Leptospira mayottensis 200901122 TaxID=1193010 RepID=A0AA87SX85_9LEPT|nr:hypothetical protein LEP1GSC125_1330 [Leptospira mayottensis 200901122]